MYVCERLIQTRESATDVLKNISECLVSNRRGNLCKTMKIVPVKALFAKRKKKIEKTYSTIGGAVCCIGILDTDKKAVRNIFR